jgi:hemerythrin-like domain-containing protein
VDAISLLKADHRNVQKHFKEYEGAGERAHVTKQKAVDAIIEGLSVHSAIEEQVFYPAARRAAADSNELVFESLEEHHIVKWVLSELQSMDVTDERFDAKVRVLIDNVGHHIEEEESELFPKVQKALSDEQLSDLGDQLEKAKKVAPTRPHPRSPDTPPANIVAGLVSFGVDRARDVVKAVTPGR